MKIPQFMVYFWIPNLWCTLEMLKEWARCTKYTTTPFLLKVGRSPLKVTYRNSLFCLLNFCAKNFSIEIFSGRARSKHSLEKLQLYNYIHKFFCEFSAHKSIFTMKQWSMVSLIWNGTMYGCKNLQMFTSMHGAISNKAQIILTQTWLDKHMLMNWKPGLHYSSFWINKDAPINTLACAASIVISWRTASKAYKDIFPD